LYLGAIAGVAHPGGTRESPERNEARAIHNCPLRGSGRRIAVFEAQLLRFLARKASKVLGHVRRSTVEGVLGRNVTAQLAVATAYADGLLG